MPLLNTNLKLADLPPGYSKCVTLGEDQIAIFNRPKGLFAIDNVCPHRGAPLHDGNVHEEQVVCPWHQWHFRLEDGVCTNIPGARVRSFRVEVKYEEIWVEVK